MSRRRIAGTSVEVTPLGFGAAALGGLFSPVDDQTAQATLARAFELGVGYLDTAPLYGVGLSEERVGAALRLLAEADPDRPVTLSTKVGRLLRPDGPLDDSQFADGKPFWHSGREPRIRYDLRAPAIRASLEESRERLGLDRIDIAYVHDPDDHLDQAVEEAIPALCALRDDGVLGAVGAGMNTVEGLTAIVERAAVDVILLAGRYTLLDTAALAHLLPLCEQRGVAVVLGGVLNSGLLARPVAGANFDYAPAPPQMVRRAQDLDARCARHGTTLLAAALQFAAAHPTVVSVLLGARSPHEVATAVAAFNAPVPGAFWAELREDDLLPPDAPTPQTDDHHPPSTTRPPIA